MSSIAATAANAVQMQAASFSQQIGTAVARQQIAAEKNVVALVAGASPPAPPGQGQTVDMKV